MKSDLALLADAARILRTLLNRPSPDGVALLAELDARLARVPPLRGGEDGAAFVSHDASASEAARFDAEFARHTAGLSDWEISRISQLRHL